MNRTILIWMIVFLVLMSGVVVAETNIETHNQLKTEANELKSELDNKKSEFTGLPSQSFTSSKDYLEKSKALDLEYQDLEKKYSEKVKEIKRTESSLKQSTLDFQPYESQESPRTPNSGDSYKPSPLAQKNNQIWLKANTYSIGGSNYEYLSQDGNLILITKVGDVKKSGPRVGTTADTPPAPAKKDVYAISAKDKALLELAKNTQGVDFTLAITPVKFDLEKMDGTENNPSSWKYNDDKKLNGDLAGQSVKIPSALYTADDLKKAKDTYSNSYGNIKVVATETSHTITTTVGDSKKAKEEREKLGKDSEKGIMGIFGSSSEKEIILERGSLLNIQSSSFDRDSGGELYVTQSWSADEDTLGEYKGWTYKYKDADGNLKEIEGVSVNAWGQITGDVRAALKAAGVPEDKIEEEASRIEVHSNKVTFNKFMGGLRAAQSWSAISSLFGFELTEWKQTVDEIFHSMFLGSEYWAEAICYQVSDLPDMDENSIFSYDSDGNLMQTATIIATKQIVDTPQGRQYLYKIAYYVNNPESGRSKNSLGNVFSRGDKISGDTGVVARGTSDKNLKELDKEEREFWNVIRKEATQISNERSKFSKAGTNENMEYNIELSGQRTIYIFQENQIIKPGDEITQTGKESIASYSNYNYDKACVVFDGVKPRNLFYKEVSEICTEIVDISLETPTKLPQVSDQMSSGFAVNEFSNIRGSGASSGRGFVR